MDHLLIEVILYLETIMFEEETGVLNNLTYMDRVKLLLSQGFGDEVWELSSIQLIELTEPTTEEEWNDIPF